MTKEYKFKKGDIVEVPEYLSTYDVLLKIEETTYCAVKDEELGVYKDEKAYICSTLAASKKERFSGLKHVIVAEHRVRQVDESKKMKLLSRHPVTTIFF